MKKALAEIKPALILIVIAILLGLTGFFLYRSLSVIANDVSSSATNDLNIPDVKSLVSELSDAEGRVKIFATTKKEDDLTPFYYSATEIEDRSHAIRQKAFHDPAQKTLADSLLSLISQRYSLLEQEIRLDSTQTPDPKAQEALQLQAISDGKQLMDKIRYLVLQMEANEKLAISQRVITAGEKLNQARTIAAVFAIVLSVMLFFVSYTIVNYIRKKREYEAALHHARQEALDMAQTREMFLANMSHEIKTPLNAISGFTEQLLSASPTPPQKAQLEIVKRAADHLIKLVHNILLHSKMEAGKSLLEKSDFDLKEAIQDIELLFKEQCKSRQVLLQTDIAASVPDLVHGDLTKIKQVLFNLIGNAVKFTEKGRVVVSVAATPQSPEELHLQLTVTDTGIGIPEHKQSNLFNAYEQINPGSSGNYQGTGLGLVITKKTIEQMGGTIRLSSREHEGTCVTVSIPVESVSEAADIQDQIISTDFLKGRKILIVDDEPFNKLLFKTILLKYNAIVSEGNNGAEALEAIQANTFDLVLMDVRMPVMNGIEACIEIRKLKGKSAEELPLIATTAVVTDEKKEKCLKAGFNTILYKPVSEHDFIVTLSRFLGGPAEAATPVIHADVLDVKVLEADTGGDETLKKELLFIFHKSINQGEADLDRMIRAGQWKEAAEVAHKLMGSCKYFDAKVLYNVLKNMENFRNQEPLRTTAESLLNQYSTELKKVNENLKLYL